MEAIKKKMQAMKVEKDNACDRVDVCEEACKAAKVISVKSRAWTWHLEKFGSI